MDGTFATPSLSELSELSPASDHILDIQTADGAIPWFESGPWDPWNHVESAMALCVMGEWEAAAKAYDHLVDQQREDGAWLGEYGNALPMVDRDFISREKAPAVLDSNFCAYPATGVAHYLKVTGDQARVATWWPMVEKALDFVLTLQRADGTFSWAQEAVGGVDDDALLAGNASIAKSLECGLLIADALGHSVERWRAARGQLLSAIQNTPEAFDRRGQGQRFAMDWYYPVLAGTISSEQATSRIDALWETFIIDGQGCRCVMDEPWVTVAETAELVLALVAIGDTDRAKHVFETLLPHRDEVGVFWMGWQLEEQIFWPREQPSWTQAAVILAADALFQSTPGWNLLTKSQS